MVVETHDSAEAAIAFARPLFDRLQALSQDPPGVSRPAFSPVEQAAHDLARETAMSLGLVCNVDHVGNLYMTLPGADRSLPRVMTGSHLDSVPHGGNFDGAAGVFAGLAAVKALIDRGASLLRDVTVMAIRAEEICWFPHHYLGSQAAFGLLPAGAADSLTRSDDDRTMADHMQAIGLDPSGVRAGRPSLSAADLRAFIELHIEQGPQLDLAGKSVGVVTGIRGNMRYRDCRVLGEHSHAGAIPRPLRRDGVLAAAEFISRLEAHWDALEASGIDFVATVGVLGTDRAIHAITKIPGDVRFTIDFRSTDNAVLQAVDERLRAVALEIAERRGVAIELGATSNGLPAIMDPAIRQIMQASAARQGIAAMDIVSGGGHDAATFASQDVPTAMLFVRSANGSHNPEEAMEMEDFACGVAVLVETLATLAAE